MMRSTLVFLLALLGASGVQGADVLNPNAHIKVPPAPVVPPEKAVSTFTLEEGFRLELVASEPLVNDPVAMVWDGNGRIWVAEMTGYMPDVHGKNENDPVGFIAILEDTDNDGKMDKRTVFLDKLVLPRSLALVKGGLLWADQFNLYFSSHENDRAGEPVLIQKGWSSGGNVEHKPNGLMPALDNWLYNAKSSKRRRLINGEWVQESTSGRGQWGIAQDNYGRLVSNGNSSNYRMEMLQPNILSRNPHHKVGMPSFGGSNRVYPSRPNTGINRGYRRGMLTEDGKLRGFTAACGLTIYRGDNFPPEYIGNIFTPEPSAHLVKRNIVEEDDQGKMKGRFAYENKEFLTCTDERSRIVNAYTGPDGCLYFVDMYRGILQHRTYVTPYLRDQILSRGLDKPIGLGRIYRVVHQDKKPGPKPNMLKESNTQLVQHLAHPNGWWRDTAQRLLVQRNDVSVVGPLNDMAGNHQNHLGQIHALWTLEGMGALSVAAIQNAVKSPHPKARATAVRMAELLGNTDQAQEALRAIRHLTSDKSYEVKRQLAFSLGCFKGKANEQAIPLLSTLLKENEGDNFLKDAALTGLGGQEFAFLPHAINAHTALIGKLISSIARSGNPEQLEKLTALTAKLEAKHVDSIYTALGASSIETQNKDLILDLLRRLESNLPLEHKRTIVKAMADKQNKKKTIQLKSVPTAFAHLATLNDKVIDKHLDRLKRNFRFEKAVSYIITPNEKKQYAEGKKQYEALCAACHHANGQGMPLLGPPLAGSEWVVESPDRIIALTLNGLTGPIKVNGKTYKPPEIQPIMPGIKTNPDITDDMLAAIITYTRNSWGNAAQPVQKHAVAEMRKKLAKNDELFTEKTLKKLR